MPFIRKLLRGKRIWARCDETGKLISGPNFRVDVIYNPSGRIYQALLSNLSADTETLFLSDEKANPKEPTTEPLQPKPKPSTPTAKTKKDPIPSNTIRIYTDGACTGNPGPMGIGGVIIDPESSTQQEFSEYLGHGTNNIAELMAIHKGLTLVSSEKPVAVYSDSAYALGVLFQHFKAKANQALIQTIRKRIELFPDIRFVKVLGHSGIPENERCDQLARAAISARIHKP